MIQRYPSALIRNAVATMLLAVSLCGASLIRVAISAEPAAASDLPADGIYPQGRKLAFAGYSGDPARDLAGGFTLAGPVYGNQQPYLERCFANNWPVIAHIGPSITFKRPAGGNCHSRWRGRGDDHQRTGTPATGNRSPVLDGRRVRLRRLPLAVAHQFRQHTGDVPPDRLAEPTSGSGRFHRQGDRRRSRLAVGSDTTRLWCYGDPVDGTGGAVKP